MLRARNAAHDGAFRGVGAVGWRAARHAGFRLRDAVGGVLHLPVHDVHLRLEAAAQHLEVHLLPHLEAILHSEGARAEGERRGGLVGGLASGAGAHLPARGTEGGSSAGVDSCCASRKDGISDDCNWH